jgi:hypothetical protein
MHLFQSMSGPQLGPDYQQEMGETLQDFILQMNAASQAAPRKKSSPKAPNAAALSPVNGPAPAAPSTPAAEPSTSAPCADELPTPKRSCARNQASPSPSPSPAAGPSTPAPCTPCADNDTTELPAAKRSCARKQASPSPSPAAPGTPSPPRLKLAGVKKPKRPSTKRQATSKKAVPVLAAHVALVPHSVS